MSLLRWGIAGARSRSRQFILGLNVLLKEGQGHKIIAIAAQEVSHAQFAAKVYNIPKIYDDYEKLALDTDIDIVFISTINSQRFDTAMLMLRHGKHVLCETPMTMNWEQTKELIIYAQSRKLFLMEDLACRCLPAYDFIRKELASGNIGDVASMELHIHFRVFNTQQLPINQVKDIILDPLIHCLQFICLAYNNEKPTDIQVFETNRQNSYKVVITVVIFYEGMRTAKILIHNLSHLPNQARIFGNNGIMRVPQFWLPTKVEVSNRPAPLSFPVLQSNINEPFYGSSYPCEVTDVLTCIRHDLIENPKMTHDTSLLLAKLKDEICKQLDIVYS
ncbi:Trans-1,2-dihydrobenzene-1,2-diol dehydrogenase [Camponotus japonicus]